jgi:2-iminobutanoate/2-iminopropanoate deaminase
MIERVTTKSAPVTGFSVSTPAPLSQATVFGDVIYCSGTGPLDPETREVVSDDFATQVRQTLTNLIRVVEAAGGRRDTVLKCNCYLGDVHDFATFNEVYREFFGSEFPARTTVGVTLHRARVRVEIDCIAARVAP